MKKKTRTLESFIRNRIRLAVILIALLCCAAGFHAGTEPADAVTGYVYEEGDTITFKVSQKIGTFHMDTMSVYPSFVMQDTIPAGLQYTSAGITDSAGTAITSHGILAYNASTRVVSFTMGASWLASEANYNGQTLTMTINTKALEPLTMTDVIKNIAYTNIGELSYASNEVSVSVVKPDLILSKASDKDTYHSGETSKWTITVLQPVANTAAENVVITDEKLPAGLVMDMDSIKVSDTTAAIEKGDNSFKVTVPEIAAGKSVTVTFDAAFDPEKLAGSSIKNTASASSITKSTRISKSVTRDVSIRNTITTSIENGSITETIRDIEVGEDKRIEYTPDEGYYLQKVIVDGREVDVDTCREAYTFKDIRMNHDIKAVCALIPELKITKEADKQTYNSGERVKYTIKATQEIKGAIAKNIVITDAELPEALVIDMNSIKTDDETASLEKGENSFSVHVPEMDDEKTVTVTLEAIFDPQKLISSDITNTAILTANTDGMRFDAKASSSIRVLNRITTEIENGTITENIEDIRVGEEKTVCFAPDDGFYVKSIIVDDEAVAADEYDGYYVFEDIKDNHAIKVVCTMIPDLAIMKTGQDKLLAGEHVKYSLIIENIKAGCTAEGITIVDNEMINGVIDTASVKCDRSHVIKAVEGGFSLTLTDPLSAGKSVRITYEAKSTDEKNATVKNTAYAIAEGMTEPVSDEHVAKIYEKGEEVETGDSFQPLYGIGITAFLVIVVCLILTIPSRFTH